MVYEATVVDVMPKSLCSCHLCLMAFCKCCFIWISI